MTELGRMADLIGTRARGRIKGSVSIEMPGTGTLYVDDSGAVESDRAADITLIASAAVFREIAEGRQDPAKAFMLRRLKVDGNPMRALKIGTILSTPPEGAA